VAKSKVQEDLEQQLGELTLDLQRTRADFENYRKRVDIDKQAAQMHGATRMVLKLLPVIDTIDRAIVHMPDDLKDNQWAQGVAGLDKQLQKVLDELQIQRIVATPGTVFDPALQQAIQMDEAEGEQEVIAEELQSGYLLDGAPIRHAMVKVTRQ
jgi:molecular chaperone GrpE